MITALPGTTSFDRLSKMPTSRMIPSRCPRYAAFLRGLAAILGTAIFTTGAVAAPASFDCVTEPSLSVKLGSPVASILDSVSVDRGEAVHAGQVVAHMLSSVEEAAVAANKVRAQSTAEIDAKEAVLKQKNSALSRKVGLEQKNYASVQDVETATAERDVAQQDVALAKLNHQMAQIELQQSQAELALRTIRSPIDGVVTQRSLGPGEFVSQQATIVSIARIDPLYVETYLPVSYYKFIAPGAQATVRPNDPFGGDRQAKVSVIDQVFDAASGTFGVRLELQNPHNAVPAGLRCKVVFDIPQDAIDASNSVKPGITNPNSPDLDPPKFDPPEPSSPKPAASSPGSP